MSEYQICSAAPVRKKRAERDSLQRSCRPHDQFCADALDPSATLRSWNSAGLQTKTAVLLRPAQILDRGASTSELQAKHLKSSTMCVAS